MQKPVYKGLSLKVGNGRKKFLYFVGIGRQFLPGLRFLLLTLILLPRRG